MSIKQQRTLLHYMHTSNLIIVHFQLYFLNTQKQAFLNNQYLKFDLIFKKLYARSQLQHADSLVVACGIWFPDQGLNSGPLHWEPGALATGPPRKSHTHTQTHTHTHTLTHTYTRVHTHSHTLVALGLHGNVQTFSSCGAEPTGSVAARGLSCPAACGNLSSPTRIKLASHALAGVFSTTIPPGKSL